MGYAVASACYREPSEAAAAYCGNVSGVTAAGVVSCQAPTVSGQTLTYTLRIDNETESVDRLVSVQLPDCEPYDWGFYGPVLGAFTVALVVILAARMVYRPFNRRETL